MPRPIHFEIQAENVAGAIAHCPQTFGWLAYANDTEGNIFGMMQMDANAK